VSLKIAFTARHTVKESMPEKQYTKPYNKSGVYQLKFLDYIKSVWDKLGTTLR
jgi:hypothetical protein